MLALVVAGSAHAFNTTMYATTSRLASGQWVKISVPESGIYEITYDELREMGFSNPARVKVYGHGGNRINEVMTAENYIDDLRKVPILRVTDSKICFYANGPVNMTLSEFNGTPCYVRQFNPYSLEGYYFLTEDDSPDLNPGARPAASMSDYVDMPTSLGYFFHEKELVSVMGSGKDMLGEEFSGEKVYVDYKMPDLADSTIMVHTVIGANVKGSISYVNGVLHTDEGSDTTAYTLASSRINEASSNYVKYSYASPKAPLKLKHPAERGRFEPMLRFSSPDANVTMARLDMFMLTYKHYNYLREENDGQLLMGYTHTNGNERFLLPNASSDVVVWNIDDTCYPVSVGTTAYSDASGNGLSFFAPVAKATNYVAFNPSKTLKKISGYEAVANQNLHGLPVPDMLIITDKLFHDQAQRVADLHAAIDGMDVLVVDQDEVFNEFSSGTRDAMAYRLLCKMMYDRNPSKFKNLLLFGTGSFDNRCVMGEHPGNLLTFQSDNSNYEDFSYTSDDFFGFLEDNSGSDVSADRLTIGIGRITCGDVAEAKSDVDKLVEYYATPDYGVWRNNTLVISDQPKGTDATLYTYQGEGYKEMIDNELQTGMNVTTIHSIQYPRSETEYNVSLDRKTATEANHMLTNMLKNGMYYATYVGHAGKVSFTKTNKMWTTGDVSRTSYRHWPIMSTACCDVAHFDGDTRGIAELMFHKRDGGAIAMLTSSRMVYASGNDLLNRYFITGMFSHAATGKMPTLGEAYKESKLGFTTGNTNKLSFFLLGDPGIVVNYPITRFNIIDINGYDMTDTTEVATIRPLMSYDLVAHVVDAEGNLDTSFNGDATMTLYDKQSRFTTLSQTVGGVTTERKIYFNRDKLGEVSGRVVNGVFTGSMIVPKTVKASNENVLVRMYAHKDNSKYMVNGFTKQVKMLPFNPNVAITDDIAPVINTMYINDEASFAGGAAVGANSMLYITVTDDQAISMQENALQNGMTLLLDGGKDSFGDITSYATVSDMGREISIEYPVMNLGEGYHTLTYTVYDLLGNSATRSISFMVGQSGMIDLVADKMPAYVNGTVAFDAESSFSSMPDVAVSITDALGNLVWKKENAHFPLTWDMKDRNGNPVPAGLYRYYGTYSDGTNHGGTSIYNLVVLDPVKRAGN